MVRGKTLCMIGAVLAALALAWWLWPSDKQAIRSQLKILTELSAKQAAEPGVEALTKAAQIARLFTDPCRVVFEEYERDADLNKKTIINQVLLIRNQAQHLHISFHDTVITLGEEETAEVATTVRVDSKGTDELFRDIREVKLNMKKLEGDWLIAELTLVQVLDK